MKRTLAALGVLLATLFVAAPAHADDQTVCNTVPSLPGSCLDDATYRYLTGLQSAYTNQVQQSAALYQEMIAARSETTQVRAELATSDNALAEAARQTASAQAQRDSALRALGFQKQRNDALRTKVAYLWSLLHGKP